MKIEVGKEYKVLTNHLAFKKDDIIRVAGFDVHDSNAFRVVLNETEDHLVFKDELEKMVLVEYSKPSKPAHYDTAIDTIAFAKANFTPEQVEGFMRINAIKYLQRAGKKDDKLSDLNKCLSYVKMLIELEAEKGGR